jgi:carbon monoxide dehydrogenase subunit G
MGEPVAAIAADDLDTAVYAATLVDVDLEELPQYRSQRRRVNRSGQADAGVAGRAAETLTTDRREDAAFDTIVNDVGGPRTGGLVILEGKFTIQAPQALVWEAIWDIPRLASWVPGCTNAVQVDVDTYRAHLEQQVSFLKASFDLLLTVVETDPPKRIRLHGEGEDRRLRSNVRVETDVMLEPAGDATLVRYRHDVSVFGRLGALGFPLIQRKTRELETEFARRASAALGEG